MDIVPPMAHDDPVLVGVPRDAQRGPFTPGIRDRQSIRGRAHCVQNAPDP